MGEDGGRWGKKSRDGRARKQLVRGGLQWRSSLPVNTRDASGDDVFSTSGCGDSYLLATTMYVRSYYFKYYPYYCSYYQYAYSMHRNSSHSLVCILASSSSSYIMHNIIYSTSSQYYYHSSNNTSSSLNSSSMHTTSSTRSMHRVVAQLFVVNY